MKCIYFRTKILSGLITGSILISSASTTFASTSNPLNNNAKTSFIKECKQLAPTVQQGLETKSQNLVLTNTITQDEADKIKAVINRPKAIKKTNSNNSKTMTEQKHKSYLDNNMINHINPLTSLVDNGTINQTQADKIIMKQLYLCHVKMLDSLL